MPKLSLTALAILAEEGLVATPIGLTGKKTGRHYPKRISDPMFRAGLLTTTYFHLFTKGVRATPAGTEALREYRLEQLEAQVEQPAALEEKGK